MVQQCFENYFRLIYVNILHDIRLLNVNKDLVNLGIFSNYGVVKL